MTEEEAKLKWCPMSRVAIPQRDVRNNTVGHTVANRLDDYKFPFHSACIGSNCMMWRWEKVENPEGNPLNKPLLFIDSTTDGYCGLAK